MKKRILASLVAVIMVFTMMPQQAFAENVVGVATENTAESAAENAAGSAAENTTESAAENAAGSAAENVAGSADENVAGSADENAAGSADESIARSVDETMIGVLSNGDLLTGKDKARGVLRKSGEVARGGASKSGTIADVVSGAEMDKIVAALTDLDKFGPKTKFVNVSVGGYGITVDNVGKAVQYIFNCSPELFYFTSKYKYAYSGNNVQHLTFELDDSVKEIKRKFNVIDKEVAKFDRLVEPGMSDEDLALLVHDYLAANVVYDIDGLEDGTASKSIYDIYGVFGDKLAVCQGYAMAAEYLLNRYNVQCGIASSKKVNHAWNVVKIGEKWYHMDATWDDPIHDNLGRVVHQYMLISDTELFSKNQGQEKKDYVTSDRGEKYNGAVDDSYKNKFWKRSKTRIHYYDDNWYYMDSKEFKLYKYNKATGKSQLIVSDEKMPQKVVWMDTNTPGAYWASNLSRMTGDNQYLYFSTPKSIFCVDLSQPEYKPYSVFNVGKTKKQIFGLGMWKNTLIYVLKDSPNTNVNEFENDMIFSTDTSANCRTKIEKIETDYNQFTVHFAPVNLVYDDGSKIPVKYKVYYKKNSDKKYKNVTTAKTEVTIDKISRNCRYSVKVKPYYASKDGDDIYGEMSGVNEFVANPLNRFVPRGKLNKIFYTSVPTKLQIKTNVPYIEGGKTTCQLAYRKVGAKNYSYKTFSGSNYNLTGLSKKTSYQMKLRFVHVDNQTGKKIFSNYSPVKVVQTKA